MKWCIKFGHEIDTHNWEDLSDEDKELVDEQWKNIDQFDYIEEEDLISFIKYFGDNYCSNASAQDLIWCDEEVILDKYCVAGWLYSAEQSLQNGYIKTWVDLAEQVKLEYVTNVFEYAEKNNLYKNPKIKGTI